MIVVRVRDQDGARCHAVGKAISEPAIGVVGIDHHPHAPRRRHHEAGVSDVLHVDVRDRGLGADCESDRQERGSSIRHGEASKMVFDTGVSEPPRSIVQRLDRSRQQEQRDLTGSGSRAGVCSIQSFPDFPI